MNTVKYLIVISVILLSLFIITNAQDNDAKNVGQSLSAQRLSPDKLQKDFDILRKALEEAHGGLYRFSTKKDLNQRFDFYRAQLNREYSQPEFISILSEMLAEVRDGHMRLEYDDTTNAALSAAPTFPLRVMIEDTRLMVMFNETAADSSIRPGMEILSINNRPADQILKTILPRISGDGFIETGKKRRLERNFSQNLWLFVDPSAKFLVMAKDKQGNQITATLSGVLNTDRISNRNKNPVNSPMINSLVRLDGSSDNVSLRFIENTDVAYLRIRAFDGENYSAAIEQVFRQVSDKAAKAMILDLRGNGGGVDEYGALLVSNFTDKPFRYFDRIHLTTIQPSFATWKTATFESLRTGTVSDSSGGYLVTSKLHTGVGEQQPAKYPFLGKVIVLLDGITFSTAADVTAILRNLNRATFVGEESGGAVEGNISGLNAQIILPNSKLRLKIQMYEYWNAVTSTEKGRGTIPDYPVAKKAVDLLEGIDAQWNRALELAQKGK